MGNLPLPNIHGRRSNWKDLSSDLLSIIADHLNLYIDYVRFRGVCLSWRSSLPTWPKHSYCNIPWLMLPDEENKLRGFCNLLNQEVIYFELPKVRDRIFLGSSNGWLATLDDGLTIKLLNLLTKSQIRLPPITSFPEIKDYDPTRYEAEYSYEDDSDAYYLIQSQIHFSYMHKIVFSLTSSNDFMAVALYGLDVGLAFTKFGDDTWTTIPTSLKHFRDCIFFNEKIYAITTYGELAVFTMNTPTQLMKLSKPKLKMGSKLYLVKTDDELLLVERQGFFGKVPNIPLDIPLDERPFQNYTTLGFNLFKLDFGKNMWVKMNKLDDYSIFVGFTSICVSSRNCPKLRGNHIYCADDLKEFHIQGLLGGYDFGVFNITDGSFQSMWTRDHPSRFFYWVHPMWVMFNTS